MGYSANNIDFDTLFLRRAQTMLPDGLNPSQRLYFAGDNTNNAGGIPGVTTASTPVQITAATNWRMVAATANNGIAVTMSGEYYAWGDNVNGALGLGDTTARSTPTLKNSHVFYAVDSGKDFTLGLRVPTAADFGQVNEIRYNRQLYGYEAYCWGFNGQGQLGDGTLVNKSTFSTVVPAPFYVYRLAAGATTGHAVKNDGGLYGWGTPSFGQIGNSSLLARSTPVQIGSATNWATPAKGVLAPNGFNTAAIKSDGTLWLWGHGSYGQIGEFTFVVHRSSPVQVGSLTNWIAVATGYSTFGIQSDKSLWSWGYNNVGQLGDGTVINKSSPVQLGALQDWRYVKLGFVKQSAAAVKMDGTLWTWGDNSSYSLGQGDTTNRSSPTQVGSLTNWSMIARNSDYLVAGTTS